MRSISERHLAVVIPLLAGKIRDLTLELRASDARADDLTEMEVEERCQLQEMLEQYDEILETIRSEYEEALAEGINLPTYERLTERFRIFPD